MSDSEQRPGGNGARQPLGVTVAVMTYNEVASLEYVVREIYEELRRMGCPYEIVIIDDGSTDGSGAVADRLARELEHVRVLRHETNLGLGAVYRDGFTCGTLDLVTLFPADGQFEASIIPRFARRCEEADMVLGYVPEFGKNRSAVARFFSWGERLLFKILFGGFPEFQGIMMFRRALLNDIRLTSTGRGWIIQMELILRLLRKGCRVVSEPTGLRARMSGRSKVSNLRSILSNLRQVLALRWRLWFL